MLRYTQFANKDRNDTLLQTHDYQVQLQLPPVPLVGVQCLLDGCALAQKLLVLPEPSMWVGGGLDFDGGGRRRE